MQTVTMTLTEFLLARIAEDEEDFAVGPDDATPEEWQAVGDLNEARLAWVNRRMLAECDAKRRIVNRSRGWLDEDPDGTATDIIARDLLGHVVKCLALPYADHPDYREEWKP